MQTSGTRYRGMTDGSARRITPKLRTVRLYRRVMKKQAESVAKDSVE
jgi:hypothetical protein